MSKRSFYSARPGGRSRQRGAALIVALLVVAMAVMLATTLSSDFLLMFRRVENQMDSEQAYAYLLGAEGLARAALLEDLQNDSNNSNNGAGAGKGAGTNTGTGTNTGLGKGMGTGIGSGIGSGASAGGGASGKDNASAGGRVDYLTESWAQELRLPTDYGWIGGHIEDAQGRFNLNQLATPGQQKGAGTGTGTGTGATAGKGKSTSGTGTTLGAGLQPQLTPAQLQFVRLLRSLPLDTPLDESQAQELTEAITDWIDGDDEVTGMGGAESQFYSHEDPPGRPANRDLVSPSELMWVKGMTPEIYRALAPLVTVWPSVNGDTTTSGSTTNGSTAQDEGGININTAPPGVLACLGDDKDTHPLEENEIAAIVKERTQKEFFKSAADLRNEPELQSKQIRIDNLTAHSSYFILNAQTEFQGRTYSLHSLLYRDEQNLSVQVIERTFGEW